MSVALVGIARDAVLCALSQRASDNLVSITFVVHPEDRDTTVGHRHRQEQFFEAATRSALEIERLVLDRADKLPERLGRQVIREICETQR